MTSTTIQWISTWALFIGALFCTYYFCEEAKKTSWKLARRKWKFAVINYVGAFIVVWLPQIMSKV